MSKRVKISFETVNRGNYTVISTEDRSKLQEESLVLKELKDELEKYYPNTTLTTMLTILLATVTSVIVGNVEISPGICQVDYLQEHSEIVTVIQECNSTI